VPASAVEALNLQGASWFGRNEDEYVLVLDTSGQVEGLRPDLERIRRLPPLPGTCRKTEGHGLSHSIHPPDG